jgi:hypothetical protein
VKRTVIVTHEIEVTVDETKFTPEWLAEWRESYYRFWTVEDHIRHIGQLAARGMLNETFTEGYGPLADMGIEARVVSLEVEIE